MSNEPTKKRQNLKLWQFLLEFLKDESSPIIEWIRKSDAEFKLIDPNEVARLWGLKTNKPDMDYTKFSRSMRSYYDKGILCKVSQRYAYKFINIPAICQFDSSLVSVFKPSIEPREINVTTSIDDVSTPQKTSHRYQPYAKKFNHSGSPDRKPMFNDFITSTSYKFMTPVMSHHYYVYNGYPCQHLSNSNISHSYSSPNDSAHYSYYSSSFQPSYYLNTSNILINNMTSSTPSSGSILYHQNNSSYSFSSPSFSYSFAPAFSSS